MTCLKYGQCHYWFNLNRPLVIVPRCGSPWMLKWLMWLKNSGEEDKPSPLCWEKKKKKIICKTVQVDICVKHRSPAALYNTLFNLFPLCSSSSVATLSGSCIIMTAIMKWTTLKMSCIGPYTFFFLIFSSSISLSVVKRGKTCLVSTINHNNKLRES